MRYLPLVLTLACFPIPGNEAVDAVCPSGTRLSGTTDCDGYQHQIDRTLAAFADLPGDDLAAGFSEWKIIIKPEVSVLPNAPGDIMDCHRKHLFLESDEWRTSALSHAYAHARDGCNTLDHEGWGVEIYPAIRVAQFWGTP